MAEKMKVSIFVRVLNRFFDRWMLVVIFLVGRYKQTEYEEIESDASGWLCVLPAALRAYAILGLVNDACKIFTGKVDGFEIKGEKDSRGVQTFARIWSNSWLGYTIVGCVLFIYYALMLHFHSTGNQSDEKRHIVIESGSVLVRFVLDWTSLVSLMGVVQVAQQHELEIASFSHRLVGQYENASYSGTYRNLQKLFDVLKMMMAVQFFTLILTSTSIMHVAFDSYSAHPVTLFLLYIFGIATPFLYSFFSLIASSENAAVETRDYTVWSLFFAAVACTAIIGAFRGCSADDTAPQFLVYWARANAMPTSFGFGMCFLSSPAAARFSASWNTLPFPLRLLLAPMPWLSTHLMQQLHIASGAVFFFPGLYHSLAWILIVLLDMVTKYTAKLIFTIPTGVCLALLGTKLMWPPGMVGMSSRFKFLTGLDNFLKDSKYGSYHVYFVKFCFVLYIAHATVRQYPRAVYYWGFPVIAYVILVFLHPAKSTYFYAYFVQYFLSQDSFDRKYTTLGKRSEPIRKGTLSSVTLHLKAPTYDDQFGDIMYSGSKEYLGFCDVILIKFRQKQSAWAREVETVHYYSTVGISRVPCEEGHQIEARLMIQKTGRRGGCSDELMSTAEDTASSIEVLGFLKSNAMESVYTPGIVAFGWESGAAAFCSIFKHRRSRQIQSQLLNVSYEKTGPESMPRDTDCSADFGRLGSGGPLTSDDFEDGLAFASMQYSKDLFVVWTTFCRARGPMTPEVIATAIKELVKLQRFLQDNSGAGVKFIFIATNVPSQWIPDAERLVFDCDDMSGDVTRLLGGENEPRQSWASPPMRESSVSKRKGGDSGVELGAVSSPMVPVASADAGSTAERPSLCTTFAPTPEQTILKLQNREESWVSFRYALTSKWKKFQDVTYRRVAESIAWLNSPGGPDCTTLFVPEHESDVDTLREFKYSAIYDEVNRAIIDAHLKYLKNPMQFINKTFGEDGDPLRPSVISCDVLYSGDYASSKLDSLKSVVQAVAGTQGALRVPAALNFVPDA